MYERGQRMIHMAQNKQNQLCGAYHWQQRLKTQTYEHHKYPRHRLTGASSGRMSLVDVDVRCPVLVPFCCISQKGPCGLWGRALMPEASFLRQTPSTWRTETLLRLALAQGSLTSHPERDRTRGRPKSLWCDATLTESKHARCQASRWGILPICQYYGFPPLSFSD